MKTFIIKVKEISYGYRVVEAENTDGAMKIIPFSGDTIIVQSGAYENLDIKEFQSGDSVLLTGPGYSPDFEVVKKEEFADRKKELTKQLGFIPCLDIIDESKKRGIEI